jgi:branched-chain amino acid transport system ATP-binding protein
MTENSAFADAAQLAANRPAIALEVRNVRKSFGAVHAVDGCSIDVPEGDIIGLIGPNGSGKSTLIETISGLTRCDSGSIVLRGVDIGGLAPHRRARLGLRRTFQASRLWMQMSVAENLLAATPQRGRDRLWRTYFRTGAVAEAEARSSVVVSDVLDRFGLADLRDQAAGTLSGGQGRLLEFARILVSEATVALLDEPLAGVNPVMAASVISGIAELKRNGISILLVEHNLSAVEDLCTSVYGMSQGKVVIHGSMDEIADSAFFAEAYIGTPRLAGG